VAHWTGRDGAGGVERWVATTTCADGHWVVLGVKEGDMVATGIGRWQSASGVDRAGSGDQAALAGP
jgi:hypothetical protein